MRFLLAWIIFTQTSWAGLPPTTLRQQQGTSATTFNFEVPNLQATKTGGVNSLIETGNDNILANPGFEHATYNTSHTCSGTGTISAETTAPLSGKKSLKIVTSSQTGNCYQSSTLYSALYSGQQLFLKIKASNTSVGAKICPRVDDAQVSANCITMATDGALKVYEIPFIGGATNNGYELDIASSTGTTIIDDVYVGIPPSGSIYEVGAVGPWVDYGPITIGATTTAPTKGTTTTDKVRCRQVGEDVECDYRFRQTTAGTNGSGDYLISLPGGIKFSDIYPRFTSAGNLHTQDSAQLSRIQTSSSILRTSDSAASLPFVGAVVFSDNQFRMSITSTFFSVQNWSSAYFELSGTNFNFNFIIKFRAANLNPRINLYSQQCVKATDCENVFSAKVSAAGVVSDENLDWIDGNAGVSSSQFTITYNSLIFSAAPNCTVTSQTTTDFGWRIRSISSSTVVVETLVTSSGSASAQPFNIICQKQGADYKFRNVITGSFEGIEKCADPYECTNTFSADIQGTASPSTVTSENIDWIDGSCTRTATGVYDCPIKPSIFTVLPTCTGSRIVGSGNSSFAIAYDKAASTVSSLRFRFSDQNGGPFNSDFSVVCQKQGVDFRPKTAVAGTFLDSVTSPGAGKVVLCSAKVSATGVITDQIGGCFASCTNATTPVCTFTSGFWVSGSVPNCWGDKNSAGFGFYGETSVSSTSFSWQILNSSGAAVAGNRQYFCHGLSQ